MAYDVDAIRNKLKKSQAGKFVDPDEFKPEKAKSATEPIKYRFFVLPPFGLEEKLKTGISKKEMEQFFVQHANHWVNDRPHACPRVWDGTECPICQFGFDLLRDEKDEDKRRAIIKQWMPTTYYAVNIFFSNWKQNPEELRGRTRWYNAPKTCFDLWTATLMKEDDGGDPEEPEAYGVFFDETAGFLFQLEVLKHGRQNSYRTSKFLAAGGATPMIKDKDGNHDAKQAAVLLGRRHNLFDKLEEPDLEKITRLYRVMAEGDDEDTGGGFDKDETEKKETPPPKKEKKETPPPKKKEKPPKDDDDDEDVVTNLPDEDGDSDGDALADEAPLEKKEEPKEESDVDSNEIENLLSQLSDDD